MLHLLLLSISRACVTDTSWCTSPIRTMAQERSYGTAYDSHDQPKEPPPSRFPILNGKRWGCQDQLWWSDAVVDQFSWRIALALFSCSSHMVVADRMSNILSRCWLPLGHRRLLRSKLGSHRMGATVLWSNTPIYIHVYRWWDSLIRILPWLNVLGGTITAQQKSMSDYGWILVSQWQLKKIWHMMTLHTRLHALRWSRTCRLWSALRRIDGTAW